MSDTDARSSEVQYVRGDSYSTPAQWRSAFWGMSDSAPFYQANADMYQLTRITGGIWGPLRASSSNSAQCHPACSTTNPTTASRVEYSCNTTSIDIRRYIDTVMGSNPFMIVPKQED